MKGMSSAAAAALLGSSFQGFCVKLTDDTKLDASLGLLGDQRLHRGI